MNFLSTLFLSSWMIFAPAFAALNDVDRQEIPPVSKFPNGGFENGKAGWSASGGTFSTTTTSPMSGSVHATWDSSSAGQTLRGPQITIKDDLANKNAVAVCLVKVPSGTATHKFGIYDGSNSQNVNLVSSTIATPQVFNFIAGDVGSTVQVEFTSVASDEPSIAIDNCFITLASLVNVSNISQASLYGSIAYAQAANCVWSTTSTSFANYSADPDCPTPTVTGNASAPSTKIPGITFSNLPPGEYLFIANAYFAPSGTGTASQQMWQFSDGTNSFGQAIGVSGGASSGDPVTSSNMIGRIRYETGKSNITIQVQGKTTSASISADIINGATSPANRFEILVYRFPLSSQLAYTPDIGNWRVDASISGANISTSATSSYSGLEHGSLTLTNNPTGTAPAQITCSSTNPPSGTTCSSGNESVGVAFNIPRAGTYRACATFAHEVLINSPNPAAHATFQIVETPPNAQTILQEGNGRQQSGLARVTTGLDLTTVSPHYVCGVFNFSSAGQKALRLFHERTGTPISSLVLADGSTSNGQRDIHFEVYPIDQQFPMPKIVNSVVTSAKAVWAVESATIASDDTVSNESGDWINGNCTDATTGKATCEIHSGIFSATPNCFCTKATANGGCQVTSVSSTSFTVITNNDAGTAVDVGKYVICHGPR